MEHGYKIEREEFFRKKKEEREEYYRVVKYEEEKNRADEAHKLDMQQKRQLFDKKLEILNKISESAEVILNSYFEKCNAKYFREDAHKKRVFISGITFFLYESSLSQNEFKGRFFLFLGKYFNNLRWTRSK